MSDSNFWKNKKVLITGHTGFKGSWLTLMLNELGAKVSGISLDPISTPNFFDGSSLKSFLVNDYRVDITNFHKVKSIIKKIKPSVIFHLAGQSSVLVSYKKPLNTIYTNVIGTTNILEITREIKTIKSMIVVTSDKVYLNLENKKIFKENDKLGGNDIYSSSKAACDILTESYIKSFQTNNLNCNIAVVRAGNCIGGGDWTEDRIIKDCVEAFKSNKILFLRHPNATRPWQHVIEPLSGYIQLALKLYNKKGNRYVGSWNFGPNFKKNFSVLKIAKIGKLIMKSASKIRIKKSNHIESINLSINSSKSKKILNWKIILTPLMSIYMTFEWYKKYYQLTDKKKIIDFTLKQIRDYKDINKKL